MSTMSKTSDETCSRQATGKRAVAISTPDSDSPATDISPHSSSIQAAMSSERNPARQRTTSMPIVSSQQPDVHRASPVQNMFLSLFESMRLNQNLANHTRNGWPQQHSSLSQVDMGGLSDDDYISDTATLTSCSSPTVTGLPLPSHHHFTEFPRYNDLPSSSSMTSALPYYSSFPRNAAGRSGHHGKRYSISITGNTSTSDWYGLNGNGTIDGELYCSSTSTMSRGKDSTLFSAPKQIPIQFYKYGVYLTVDGALSVSRKTFYSIQVTKVAVSAYQQPLNHTNKPRMPVMKRYSEILSFYNAIITELSNQLSDEKSDVADGQITSFFNDVPSFPPKHSTILTAGQPHPPQLIAFRIKEFKKLLRFIILSPSVMSLQCKTRAMVDDFLELNK